MNQSKIEDERRSIRDNIIGNRSRKATLSTENIAQRQAFCSLYVQLANSSDQYNASFYPDEKSFHRREGMSQMPIALFFQVHVVLVKSLEVTIHTIAKETLFFGLFVIFQKIKSCLLYIWTCSTQAVWRILRPYMGSWFLKNKHWCICTPKARKMKPKKSKQIPSSFRLTKALALIQNQKYCLLTTWIN